MMKFLALFDNPFFLKHWYVRMRARYAITETCVLLLSFVCVLLVAVVTTAPDHVAEIMLMTSAAIEGVLLLIIAPYCVAQAALEEQYRQTLDFHRTSPTPASHYVLGAIIGPGVLEWILAGVFFPILAFFAVLCKLSIITVLLAAISLVCTSLMCCSASALLGFDAGRRLAGNQKSSSGFAGGVSLIFCIFFLGLVGQPDINFLSLFLGVNAPQMLFGFNGGPFGDPEFVAVEHRWAYFGIQLIAQIPTILILLAGIHRAFRQPTAFLLSKRMIVVTACVYLVDLFVALKLSWHDIEQHGVQEPFTFILLVVGAFILTVCAAFTSPVRLQHSRAVMRAKMLGRSGLRWHEDGAGISKTLFIYLLIFSLGAMGIGYLKEFLVADIGRDLGRFELILVFCGWISLSWQWTMLRWGAKARVFYLLVAVSVFMVFPLIGYIVLPGNYDWILLPSLFSIIMVSMDSAGTTATFVAATHIALLAVFALLVFIETRKIRATIYGQN